MVDKRKNLVVTMKMKLCAVNRLRSGTTAQPIATELGVRNNTVDNGKNQAGIEKWCSVHFRVFTSHSRGSILKTGRWVVPVSNPITPLGSPEIVRSFPGKLAVLA